MEEAKKIAKEAGQAAIVAGAALGAAWWTMNYIKNWSAKRELGAFMEKYMEFRGLAPGERMAMPSFNEYECRLMQNVTFPQDVEVSFEDIGGLLDVKEAVYECVILPLERPELFAGDSKLLTAPRGVLFYGPPGTGKTMTAKAIAHDSRATFISVDTSVLMDKWVGESEKMVSAVFSLAHKLQPSIIFVDEIDGLLSDRDGGGNNHWVVQQVIAGFMARWDGLNTDPRNRVIVLGATNRPEKLDAAVLRRLPRTFLFDLPGFEARAGILRRLLAREETAPDVSAETLAELTEGYSGSDLTEMAKAAAYAPIRDFVKQGREQKARDPSHTMSGRPRELRLADFHEAMASVQPSGRTASEYGERKGRSVYADAVKAIAERLEAARRLDDDGAEEDKDGRRH